MKINKKIISNISIGIFSAALLVTIFSLVIKGIPQRRLFYFDSYNDNKIYTEVRYISNKSDDNEIKAFVDDLLLGPMTNRYKNIFSPNTKTEFCFLEKKDLYLGLSKDALFVNDETFDIKKSVELLRLNIVKNFTNINNINIYIDGKSVWD